MFNDFIKNLCNAENLVDIAPEGTAKQSSTSKWSRYNDAQRATQDIVYENYAFHTNKEVNPWWQIEWSKPVKLSYVIINNRKQKPYDKIASTLKVVMTTEDEKEICLHSGNLLFGSLPNSMPLILPVNYDFRIKKIKLILEAENYLHLCNIHCLKKMSLQEREGRLQFFANRRDGLGERLRSILNAMKMASKYKGDYRFFWERETHIIQNFHAIDDAANMFGKSVVSKHLLQRKDGYDLIDVNRVSQLDYETLKEYDGILVHQGSTSLKEPFEALEFNDKLSEAKNAAMKVELSSNTIAIHLRTGDIVYGHHRFSNIFYFKVIPIYILDNLIKIYRSEDAQIVIFGQDVQMCQFLAQRHNVIYAGDLGYPSFDKIQNAIFEIVLMSRCKRIIAKKSSGFAALPALIGGSQILDYTDCLLRQDIIKSFQESILDNGLIRASEMNPLLKAFSIVHFLTQFKADIDLVQRNILIDECVNLDPENSYYKLLQAMCYYDTNKFAEADKIVLNELNLASKKYGIYFLASDFEWRKTVTLTQYIDSFKRAADKGSLAAAILVLLHQHNVDKKINIEYFEKLINVSSDSVAGFGLLQQKFREFVDK